MHFTAVAVDAASSRTHDYPQKSTLFPTGSDTIDVFNPAALTVYSHPPWNEQLRPDVLDETDAGFVRVTLPALAIS